LHGPTSTARTGDWPHRESGQIPGSLGEKWRRVDNALVYGLRGLPGGSSLAQLLAERRGVRNIRRLPRLTEEQIGNSGNSRTVCISLVLRTD
jgi:hypothetical protein